MSCDLVRSLQHLHQEGVDRRVPDQLEEKQMLQTLEANGAQGGQAEQQLGKPANRDGKKKRVPSALLYYVKKILITFTIQIYKIVSL